jgi:hypothetical protein
MHVMHALCIAVMFAAGASPRTLGYYQVSKERAFPAGAPKGSEVYTFGQIRQPAPASLLGYSAAANLRKRGQRLRLHIGWTFNKGVVSFALPIAPHDAGHKACGIGVGLQRISCLSTEE